MAATGMPASVSGNTFNADNGMTAFNGIPMTYDANGKLTSDGTNTYTWDARNHLTAIGGAVTASFEYDALGRRISKTINGTTTQFLYDGLNPVQEIQSGSPSANLLTGLNIDEVFQRTDSAGSRDFLTDTLGSTLALADSSGAIQTSYTYEPFGNTTVSGASSTNPFQFTGRENDATGLYYYRARYYSPIYQRFIAQDPIGFAGRDPNLYEYAANDPTDLADATGKFPGYAIPAIISTFNSDPCALGRFLAMAAGMALGRLGLFVGVPIGATLGFGAGEAIEPLGGGFPGAFVGGAVGGGFGFAAGVAAGGVAGGAVGDELGAALGLPGCNPNKPCGGSE
jgi:RHS repeat-associated protein